MCLHHRPHRHTEAGELVVAVRFTFLSLLGVVARPRQLHLVNLVLVATSCSFCCISYI
jgi:hypothetical protein